MILSCPSCGTHYFAEDSTIGESGRNVKCASCGHSWLVRPAPVAGQSDDPGENDLTGRGGSQASLRERSRRAAMAAWLFTMALAVGLFAGTLLLRDAIVRVWPQSAAAYRALGFEVNRFGLEFAGIEHSRTFIDTLPVVTVAGEATNVTRMPVPAAGVRVDLKDDSGGIVATQFGMLSPAELAPGESGSFAVTIEPAPIESFEIFLTFVDRRDVDTPPGAGREP